MWGEKGEEKKGQDDGKKIGGMGWRAESEKETEKGGTKKKVGKWLIVKEVMIAIREELKGRNNERKNGRKGIKERSSDTGRNTRLIHIVVQAE